jgi:hypothetical protein
MRRVTAIYPPTIYTLILELVSLFSIDGARSLLLSLRTVLDASVATVFLATINKLVPSVG